MVVDVLAGDLARHVLKVEDLMLMIYMQECSG
jgi:hypothetical protein